MATPLKDVSFQGTIDFNNIAPINFPGTITGSYLAVSNNLSELVPTVILARLNLGLSVNTPGPAASAGQSFLRGVNPGSDGNFFALLTRAVAGSQYTVTYRTANQFLGDIGAQAADSALDELSTITPSTLGKKFVGISNNTLTTKYVAVDLNNDIQQKTTSQAADDICGDANFLAIINKAVPASRAFVEINNSAGTDYDISTSSLWGFKTVLVAGGTGSSKIAHGVEGVVQINATSSGGGVLSNGGIGVKGHCDSFEFDISLQCGVWGQVTSDGHTTDIIGVKALTQTNGDSTQDNVYGVYSDILAGNMVTGASGSTVNNPCCYRGTIRKAQGTLNSITGSAMGLWLTGWNTVGLSGVPTTAYGVRIDSSCAIGSVNNYAIYSEMVAPSVLSGQLRLPAGTTSAAPLRLTSGALTTGGNIVAGNIEFLTDAYYGTVTTGTERRRFVFANELGTASAATLSTDPGLATDSSSDSIVLSERAIKTWVDARVGFTGADPGPSIASASVLDLTGNPEDYAINITGSTDIIQITMTEEGEEHVLTFQDGGLDLINDPAKLILQGGKTQPISAGTWGLFRATSDPTVVQCLKLVTAEGYKRDTFEDIFMQPGANIGYAQLTSPYFDIGNADDTGASGHFIRATLGAGIKLITHNLSNSVEFDLSGLTGQRIQRFPDIDGTIALVEPRTQSVASDTTPNPDADLYDMYMITAMTGTIASFPVPTGGTTNGRPFIIRLTAAGGDITISAWAAGWRQIGVTLPSSVASGKTVYIKSIYNADSSTWDAIHVATQA